LARKKGIKVVFSDFLGNLAARPEWRIALQRTFVRSVRSTLTPARAGGLNWESFRKADACIALTSAEAKLMLEIFGSSPERVHIVPNGVEEVFFQSSTATRNHSRH
jgi:hypothetical protein